MILGLEYFVGAPITGFDASGVPSYGVGRQLGGENIANWTPTVVSGSFPVDNRIAHRKSYITGGTLDITLDDMEQADAAAIFGGRVDNGVWIQGGNDKANPWGVGYITHNEDFDGNPYWESFLYCHVEGTPTADNATTRGESITMTGTAIQFFAYCLDDADTTYRKRERFNSRAAAKAWLDAQLNVADMYEIEVSVSGTGTVSPVGVNFAGAGDDFVIAIGGTPTKVYDNGTDVTASVSGGEYEISTVAAAHSVVVIYTA